MKDSKKAKLAEWQKPEVSRVSKVRDTRAGIVSAGFESGVFYNIS